MIRSGSAEPVGGAPRFQTVVNRYRSHPKYAEQPALLTFFSGDAFNPSLESTVTKGRHMVPFLNEVGTDVACVGVSVVSVMTLFYSMPSAPILIDVLLSLRTTILISGLPNSGILGVNANFRGS